MRLSRWAVALFGVLVLGANVSYGLDFSHAIGGDSSGGGNELNDLAIESYSLDPSKLAGYDQVVSPVLDRLKTITTANEFLSEFISESPESLTWYLLPVSISTLPAEQTGLPFVSGQAMVQSHGEVFIDKGLFEALSGEQQGTLILHEVVLHGCLEFAQYDKPIDQTVLMGRVRRITIDLLKTQSTGQALVDELNTIWFDQVD
jgi:hypothetical protein